MNVITLIGNLACLVLTLYLLAGAIVHQYNQFQLPTVPFSKILQLELLATEDRDGLLISDLWLATTKFAH